MQNLNPSLKFLPVSSPVTAMMGFCMQNYLVCPITGQHKVFQLASKCSYDKWQYWHHNDITSLSLPSICFVTDQLTETKALSCNKLSNALVSHFYIKTCWDGHWQKTQSLISIKLLVSYGATSLLLFCPRFLGKQRGHEPYRFFITRRKKYWQFKK